MTLDEYKAAIAATLKLCGDKRVAAEVERLTHCAIDRAYADGCEMQRKLLRIRLGIAASGD
jgi:hypothetical protein